VLTVVPDPADGDRATATSSPSPALIDELVREGARRMLAEALKAEVDAYIAQFAGGRDEAGRRLVVRNGHHEPRQVLTSAGGPQPGFRTSPHLAERGVRPGHVAG
jgi:hypothetical protein